jgi:hypothetical protein
MTVVAYIFSFLLSLSSLDGHQCEGLLCETSEGHAGNIFDCVSWTDAAYHVKGGEELVEAFWVI